MRLTYIEVFAGAGGLAEGLFRAGFEPVAYVEMDKYAVFTLKTRLSYYYLKSRNMLDVYSAYIKREMSREEFYKMIPASVLDTVINAEITDTSLPDIISIIKNKMRLKKIDRIDVLAGGPPCQAYSIVGRVRSPHKMKKDKRKYLYRLYVELLRVFRPSVFIFENVPGLLSTENGKLWHDMQKRFREAGYVVDYKILNAHDFGVLQNRKRVVVMGWKKEMMLEYPEFTKDPYVDEFRVGDIFQDLPPLNPGEKMYAGNYAGKPSRYLKFYKIRNDDDVLTLHITRNHNDRDREIYRRVIETWFREKRRLEYDELPEELKTHKNGKVFKDRFKIVAPDLPYSQTVVAHLAKDGHYFIHPDIKQLRSISVREAARLQSFPDNFYFEGPMTAMFRQIGNAVPPLMAEKIAWKIKEMLV